MSPLRKPVVIPLKLTTVEITKIRKVEIVHVPVKDILTENNAIRANSILTSLLSTLASREAIVDPYPIERI